MLVDDNISGYSEEIASEIAHIFGGRSQKAEKCLLDSIRRRPRRDASLYQQTSQTAVFRRIKRRQIGGLATHSKYRRLTHALSVQSKRYSATLIKYLPRETF